MQQPPRFPPDNPNQPPRTGPTGPLSPPPTPSYGQYGQYTPQSQPLSSNPLNRQPAPGGLVNFAQYTRLRLRFLDGPRKGEILELSMPAPGDKPLCVGRNPDCAIRIDATDVSRRHTELLINERGELIAQDLGSLNSTLVNNQPITPDRPTKVTIGDRLQMGYTIILIDGATGQLALPPLRPETPTTALANPVTPVPTVPNVTVGQLPAPAQAAQFAHADDETFVYIFLKSGQRYLFKGEEAIVGRGPTSDIVIESNSISRHHAKLQRNASGIFLSDLGSTNKTFVNGISADTPIMLHDGDILRFGDVEADFKIEDSRLSVVFDANKIRELLKDTTQEENPENTYMDMGTVADPMGVSKLQGGFAIKNNRLEEGETSLNIGLVVVGRSGRSISSALPEASPMASPYYGADQTRADSGTTSAGGIELARLERVYYTEGSGRNEYAMLKNARLGIRQGELVAMVGPSGSGKSEVLMIMGGILAADKGTVQVLGNVLPTLESTGNRKRPNFDEDKDVLRWRIRNIGYMTSNYQQLNPRLTVLEHITQVIEQSGTIHDSRQRHELAVQRLQRVGITDMEVMRMRLPDLTRREKSLVALARASANDPAIILADEPMGNLHSKEAHQLFELLQMFVAGGKTVFMVTQDQVWARVATRQIEILDGEIIGGLA